jgi:hypothetical protein
VRHTFHQQLSTRIAGAMLYGTDPKTNASLHGSFVDATVRYPLPLGFSQEMAIRHYALSGVGATPNRTIGVITLWWSPTKHRSEGQ